MKRITPPDTDRTIYACGTSRNNYYGIIVVDRSNLVKARETEDCQINYYFQQGSVAVEEFEDV